MIYMQYLFLLTAIRNVLQFEKSTKRNTLLHFLDNTEHINILTAMRKPTRTKREGTVEFP